MPRSRVLTLALAVHLVVALAHGTTHGLVPVPLPGWQNALVLVTTFVGPAVGVALDRRGHPLGLGLFTLSMAGAFVLGVLLHFVIDSPDHVHAVPASTWQLPFQLTAVFVAVTPAVGVVSGLWSARTRSTA